jgi:hypothetical protein
MESDFRAADGEHSTLELVRFFRGHAFECAQIECDPVRARRVDPHDAFGVVEPGIADGYEHPCAAARRSPLSHVLRDDQKDRVF